MKTTTVTVEQVNVATAISTYGERLACRFLCRTQIASRIWGMALIALIATSCGFGGLFAENQQHTARDELLTVLNDRGVDWSELPETWEVTNIGRISDSEADFSLAVDRSLFVSGCVSLHELAPVPTCFERQVTAPFVLAQTPDPDTGLEGSLVFWCVPDDSLCSEQSLQTLIRNGP